MTNKDLREKIVEILKQKMFMPKEVSGQDIDIADQIISLIQEREQPRKLCGNKEKGFKFIKRIIREQPKCPFDHRESPNCDVCEKLG